MSEQIRIENIERYTLEFINGALILTPKKEYITENELINTRITKSKILECIIKENHKTISTNKNKYMHVAADMWKYMSPEEIRNNTTFNYKLTNENCRLGYHWRDDIKMSIQQKDALGTLKEIIKMVKVNKFTLELSIKLDTGRIVNFKIEQYAF